MTISEILEREEGQTFDRKSIEISPVKLANTIIAFANADGGDIAIGITDTKKQIEGIDYNTEKLNGILLAPIEFCNPSVRVTYDKIPCSDMNGRPNHILYLHIEASMDVHVNTSDEAYFRVGDKSKKMSFDERVQLAYDKGERSFEDKPVPDAMVEDIDLEKVKEYTSLIGYSKSPITYLKENKNFITVVGDKERISTAAILLFGKNPQRFFPRARVRFIRYEGTDEKVGASMNVIKDVIFEGTILDVINKSISYLDSQIKEKTYLGRDGLFVTEEEYPKFVRQEIIVNAVTHRAYNITGTEIQIKMFDDHLTVESPGRLPGIVRPDNIRNTHFSRNPKIAEYLKAYKFVKEFGEGVDRMYNELEEDGFLLPEYKQEAFILRATIYNKAHEGKTPQVTPQATPQVTPQVEDKEERIKAILKFCVVPRSLKEIMEYIKLKDRKNARDKYIIPLIEAEKLVMTEPDKPNSSNQKYVVARKND
ncbi:MAG: putative DNA binding domain-containing protein [Lachnospiraceae bacterium]|nr:putative DNA binding domain-containing protein [Lachnospiraceae bacterium]